MNPVDLVISWAILTASVWLAAALLPDMRIEGGAGSYIFIAGLFGVLNFFIGWLLFVVIGFATLFVGFIFAFITRLVVTAIVLKIVDAFSDRLTIRGFGTAFLAALIMAGVGGLAEWAMRSLG